MGVPSNLEIIDPLNYEEMIDYLLRVKLIISDSGGIQEEAPSFGKKILVVRESTERPEVIKCGAGILVKNTSDNSLFDLFTLINKSDYKYNGENPFGDGKSSELIVNKILSL
jgi:UDP-N-acetylglucosamine 2-epimerase (non-hydrolysing)